MDNASDRQTAPISAGLKTNGFTARLFLRRLQSLFSRTERLLAVYNNVLSESCSGRVDSLRGMIHHPFNRTAVRGKAVAGCGTRTYRRAVRGRAVMGRSRKDR